jgi:hypothetical protein
MGDNNVYSTLIDISEDIGGIKTSIKGIEKRLDALEVKPVKRKTEVFAVLALFIAFASLVSSWFIKL